MTLPKPSKQQMIDRMEQATAPPESFWHRHEDALMKSIQPRTNTIALWSWRLTAVAASLALAWWGATGDGRGFKFAPAQEPCFTFACLIEQVHTKEKHPLPLTDQELEQLELWSSAFDNPDPTLLNH